MGEVPSLADEFRGVSLGDGRLEARLLRVADAMERRPGSSLPDMFDGDPCQLEALYRFTNNDRVDFTELLAGHQQRTKERCAQHGKVLAIHDSSEFVFNGDREGLYTVRKGESGFLGHFTLAVSADGSRCPLGVLAYQTVERKKRDKNENWLAIYNDPEKESLRWFNAVEEASGVLGDDTHAIHVMDREADSFELFDNLVRINADFVIRLVHNRRVVGSEDSGKVVMSDALAKAPVVLRRTVPLSRRGAKQAPVARAKHPKRDERVAKLEVVTCEVLIRRPHHDKKLSDELRLNIVHVREPNPPDGEPPVDWRIITSLPVGTPDEAAAVVDYYRARWLIEEYFKALKTGCAFSSRQQTTLDALERTLALSIPQAWRLLLLRWVSRQQPASPPTTVLSPVELRCLAILKPRAPLTTAREACLAVAALGGHLKSNGDPGWQVLGRGLERLRDMAHAFEAGLEHARGGVTRVATGGSDLS